MSELLILVGLPGSGKSFFARKWVEEDHLNRERLNFDDLRLQLYGPDWKWNRKDETYMKEIAEASVKINLEQGKSVVIDNTNLSAKARDRWAEIGREHGSSVVVRSFDLDIASCVSRDRRRPSKATTVTEYGFPKCPMCGEGQITYDNKCLKCKVELSQRGMIERPESARVGQAVIDRMALWNGLINWDHSIYGDRPFVLVDMDGTLADCEWRRTYLDPGVIHHKPDCKAAWHLIPGEPCAMCNATWKKDWPSFLKDVDKDPPIQPIVDLVKKLGKIGCDCGMDCYCESPSYNIIIVSGRDLGSCGIQTEDWLLNHEIPHQHLFMRSAGDSREDSIIKREILDRLPKDRIAFVLDDRDQVVKMWRENGLTCLQCAPGAF